jgi:hypothetical protein
MAKTDLVLVVLLGRWDLALEVARALGVELEDKMESVGVVDKPTKTERNQQIETK